MSNTDGPSLFVNFAKEDHMATRCIRTEERSLSCELAFYETPFLHRKVA